VGAGLRGHHSRVIGEISRANIDPKELEGRRIRVRGWVEQRRGPIMEASVPEQIEVIR
jgi:hypothetical protein